MAGMHEKTEPTFLYDTHGRILSRTLMQRANDFTLLYLRHTIEGAPLEEKLIDARLLHKSEMPSPIVIDLAGITVVPIPEEKELHGDQAPQPDPTIINVTTHNIAERHFIHDYASAVRRHAAHLDPTKELMHTQHTAIMLAMEHVLDKTAEGDPEQFASAQMHLQGIIDIGAEMLDMALKEARVPREDRSTKIRQLHDSAAAAALQNRLTALPDIDQQRTFSDTYSRLLTDFRQAELAKGGDDALNFVKHVRAYESNQARPFSQRPFASRVTHNNRDLIGSFNPAHSADNDNERER